MSNVLTANIWPNNKSSKLIVTSSKEIRTKPRAKKEEKIIPIAVSSPMFIFLTIYPRKKAMIIEAGTPSSEILKPKRLLPQLLEGLREPWHQP